jgi:chromosome partitioning protein
MILSFVNLKGGVGKSTLAINVAAALAERVGAVRVVDLDPQGSCLAWQARRQEHPRAGLLPVTVSAPPKLPTAAQVKALGEGCAHIVVDAAAGDVHIAQTALAAADLVVLPVTGSETDVSGTERTVALLLESRRGKAARETPVVLLLNRLIVNSRIGEEVRRHLRRWPHKILPTTIYQRVEFANADQIGRAVVETQPQGQAAQEIRKATRELLRLAAAK